MTCSCLVVPDTYSWRGDGWVTVAKSSLRNAPEQYVYYDSLRQLQNLSIRNKSATAQHYGSTGDDKISVWKVSRHL